MGHRMGSQTVKITKRSIDDLTMDAAPGDLLRDRDLTGFGARKDGDGSRLCENVGWVRILMD